MVSHGSKVSQQGNSPLRYAQGRYCGSCYDVLETPIHNGSLADERYVLAQEDEQFCRSHRSFFGHLISVRLDLFCHLCFEPQIRSDLQVDLYKRSFEFLIIRISVVEHNLSRLLLKDLLHN